MPPGTGRGDGDQGSCINYHIGYLNVDNEPDGKSDVKPYIRTGSMGKRVTPGEGVEFELRRYFLTRANDKENAALADAEATLADWAEFSSEAYIKIAEISRSDGAPQGNLEVLVNTSPNKI
ncbi:MAG: hypothetical protein IH947_12490 [Bacteroidetes bacterium]|nr:hypothetical protein [Bacteroidota bacterium]